jgi:transcriptional regulator with XRE-family HTH domain
MEALQCRMARVALGWGVRDLAKRSGRSLATIAKLERGGKMRPDTVADVRATLERAGVVFIEENGGGAGVRLAKRSKRK